MIDDSIESRPSEDSQPNTPTLSSSPVFATVKGHLDPTYMGRLLVEYLRPGSGNTTTDTMTATVDMITPFYGVTGSEYIGEDPNDYNNTQKAYGMWFVPPDIGTTVLVIFVNNDPKRGFWLGCVPDNLMNFMVPGIAATTFVDDDSKTVDPKRVPVAEYNKKINAEFGGDPTKIKKPQHPFTDVLDAQGLLTDDTRGITTSSARREAPSMVFGISTPGPVDKQSGAKQGARGTKEHLSPNVFVSRLGGTTFVMDDGDDKFLRRTTASEGPPDYASVENDETDGDVTIPHNELVRIRTRTGHQILLHNSEDLIYITNARGTAWIEMTSDGKIDIFAQDSISVRTANDLNFYADRDINMEAGRNFNLKVAERHQTEVGTNLNLIVSGDGKISVEGSQDTTIGADHKISTGGDLDVNTGGGNKFTAGGDTHILAANTAIDGGNINLNSGVASGAASAEAPEALSTFDLPTEVEGETLTTIMLRVPTTEPYPHHENLDPTSFKTDMTDRESGSAVEPPEYWPGKEEVKYSTATDTFAKEYAPDPEDREEEEGGEEI